LCSKFVKDLVKVITAFMSCGAFTKYGVKSKFFGEFGVVLAVFIEITAHQDVIILVGAENALRYDKFDPSKYAFMLLFAF